MRKTNSELQKRRENAVPRGVGSATAIFADRASNAEVWDVEGRRLIDFAGGIGVLNTGHRHPKIQAAIQAQLDKVVHSCFQVMPYEPYIALAEELNRRAPGDFAKKTIFLSTGAEAVENAVKIARAATGRSGIIAFSGGFHGRTMMGMALTGKVAPYKLGFAPFPAEVYHAPFPHPYRGVSEADSLAAIERLFKADIEPQRVAAIILEPVQGEGGFVPASNSFFSALREICDRHGILLIADEVQSGFARTGTLFACDQYDAAPDLITVAKSLAGGLPLSGVIGRAEVMDAPAPGGLGGTYGGNPLACASALAVLEVIEEEHLLERSREIGERFRSLLSGLQQDGYDNIGEIRGLGAMLAFELVHPDQSPAPELCAQLIKACAEQGLVILSCGTFGNTVRILVPLTVSGAVLNEGLEILARCLKEVCK